MTINDYSFIYCRICLAFRWCDNLFSVPHCSSLLCHSFLFPFYHQRRTNVRCAIPIVRLALGQGNSSAGAVSQVSLLSHCASMDKSFCYWMFSGLGCFWQYEKESVDHWRPLYLYPFLSGRFLTAQETCMSRCPSGTFANEVSGQCEGCSQGCVLCQDTKLCQRCRSELYLQNGTCVLQCHRCLSSCLDFCLAFECAASSPFNVAFGVK